MWRTEYMCRAALWSAEQPRGKGNEFAKQRSCRWPRATMEDPQSLQTDPWLWAATGKAPCLLCSEGERMKEWSHVPGDRSDGNFTKPSSILFWNYDFLAVLVALSGTQVANSHRLGCVTRPGDGNSSFFFDTKQGTSLWGLSSSLIIIIPW